MTKQYDLILRMLLTVFGANGKVGSLIVHEALRQGFSVKAFVHGKSNFESSKNLIIIDGDVYNLSNVENAIKDSDVVISALGSWGTVKKDILTEGMKNIIPSMKKHNIKRIVSLTGADAYIKGESLNITSRLIRIPINLFAHKILEDGENHIQLLIDSGLDWTVLRSPVMNDHGADSNYKLSENKPMPWETINRKSVALAMVNIINNAKYITNAPFIKRK